MPNPDYADLVRGIPDFPQPGVLFRDITPLLGDAEALQRAIDDLAAPYRNAGIDRVVGIEARGYLLGVPLALALGAGFVPVRKAGKLPHETYRVEYVLEYGEETIEMHRDGLLASHRALLVDDVLATGGTLAATIDLVCQTGAQIAGIAVLIELGALQGRSRLGEHPLTAAITY